MTDSLLLASTCAAALCCGIIGYTLVPFGAHRLLAYKFRQLDDYWHSCLRQYEALEPGDPCPEPLGLWLADSKRLISDGTFPREYAMRLAQDDAELEHRYELDRLPLLEERRDRYCSPCPPLWKLICALGCAVVGGFLAASAIPPAAGCTGFATLCFCLVMALTDVKAHILPFETTLLLVPVGIGCQAAFIACGSGNILASLVGAALYCLILLGSVLVTKAITHMPVTGKGDLRATPGFALVCAQAPLPSLCATAISMAIALATFRIRKTKTLTDSVPFGPFLAIGAAVGIIAPAAALF